MGSLEKFELGGGQSQRIPLTELRTGKGFNWGLQLQNQEDGRRGHKCGRHGGSFNEGVQRRRRRLFPRSVRGMVKKTTWIRGSQSTVKKL